MKILLVNARGGFVSLLAQDMKKSPQNSEFFEKIPQYVAEFFLIEKGSLIERPDEYFIVWDGKITRRQIKHIVEQRKAEGKTLEEILVIFLKVPETIEFPLFEYDNPSDHYPGSVIRVQHYDDVKKGIAIVLDQGDIKDVITAFTKRRSEVLRLKKKYRK